MLRRQARDRERWRLAEALDRERELIAPASAGEGSINNEARLVARRQLSMERNLGTKRHLVRMLELCAMELLRMAMHAKALEFQAMARVQHLRKLFLKAPASTRSCRAVSV
ncbi:unnamed protein product [Prorocentrum cordatum]|uniref:Uncharacterized protein n=1 Tax=Prorocentrum cordatum TaxID=2364126 RepID=A0ABN9TBM1_9DINO|nr:unnamed protein product [Polarella glacialis]